MPRLPSLKPREIEKILHREGFVYTYATGGHRFYERKVDGKIAMLAWHNKDVPRGTIRELFQSVGYSNADIFRLLGRK